VQKPPKKTPEKSPKKQATGYNPIFDGKRDSSTSGPATLKLRGLNR
jgi:hypothetical protein